MITISQHISMLKSPNQLIMTHTINLTQLFWQPLLHPSSHLLEIHQKQPLTTIQPQLHLTTILPQRVNDLSFIYLQFVLHTNLIDYIRHHKKESSSLSLLLYLTQKLINLCTNNRLNPSPHKLQQSPATNCHSSTTPNVSDYTPQDTSRTTYTIKYIHQLPNLIKLLEVFEQFEGVLNIWHNPNHTLGQNSQQQLSVALFRLLNYTMIQPDNNLQKLVVGTTLSHKLV